jgi:hypothetical protein
MQEKILILSRCITMRKSLRTARKYYRFHFKGYYRGLKINEIHVVCGDKAELSKGEDYLLWVEQLSLKETILEVRLIKYKKIG